MLIRRSHDSRWSLNRRERSAATFVRVRLDRLCFKFLRFFYQISKRAAIPRRIPRASPLHKRKEKEETSAGVAGKSNFVTYKLRRRRRATNKLVNLTKAAYVTRVSESVPPLDDRERFFCVRTRTCPGSGIRN